MAAQALHHNDAHHAHSTAPGTDALFTPRIDRVAAVIGAGVLAGVLATVFAGSGKTIVSEPSFAAAPRGEVTIAPIQHARPSPAAPALATEAPAVQRATSASNSRAAVRPPVTVEPVVEVARASSIDESSIVEPAPPAAAPDPAPAASEPPARTTLVTADPGGGLPPITVALP